MEAKFKVGKTYSMRSVCDYNCIWKFKVVRRTEKTVTLRDQDGRDTVCRVKSFLGECESCKPLGTYSMAPILCAK